jgi:ABC-type branched-subunit amino acid transport system permease subunit
VVGAFLIGIFDRILAEELTRPLNAFGEAINVNAIANHNVTSDRFLVFGLALVLMMLLKPAGLISSARRKAEMAPDEESIRVHEQQQMYDIQKQEEPVEGDRA